MTWITWLPPIITGLHLVLFGILTYLGHRQRAKFLVAIKEDRKEAGRMLIALLGREDT